MAIKLLLIEDVESLGRKGAVVSVRAGYARNFLLPQQYAIIADKNTLRKQERLKQEREQQAIVDLKESEELAQKLEDKTVTIFVKVDHEGHMYGSVSALDVQHLVQEQLNVALEKRFINLKHPLKEIGKHPITLKLKEGITATFNVKVLAEGTVEEAEAPAEAPAAE